MAKKKPTKTPTPSPGLRRQAEELLRARPADLTTLPTADVQALVHELNVHQMELEIQNEELRQAQLELACSRDRYSDLYDFAPIGYVTLDKDGKILEANLTAANLLGVERRNLVGANLSAWIESDSQDGFYLHRQAVFSHGIAVPGVPNVAEKRAESQSATPFNSLGAKQICELKMHTPDGMPLIVCLESIALTNDGMPQCYTALLDVTLRHEAEVALRQLNENLEKRVDSQTREVRLLAEAMANLGEGVMITTDQLEWPGPAIVYVNEALCRITGYTAEELLGQTPRILQGKETDKEVLKRLREELSEGRSHLCELVNKRKDGTPYDAELFITPLLDEHGKHANFIAIHRDISERKRAEATLRNSEAQTIAILAALSAHIAVVDRNGMIAAVNPAWETFARENEGLAMRCNVGANYLEVCRRASGASAEEAPKVAAGLQAILDGEANQFTLEYPCHSATQQNWFLMHITPMCLAGGGAVVSHTNITDRVLAEQLWRDREERLRVVLNTAADAIITIDERGVIDGVNSATEKMFGYTQDELIGRNVMILMPALYRDRHDGYIARYLATGERHLIGIGRDVTGRRRDGSTFPISLAVSEVHHLGLFTGIIRDISDRRNLQKQVLEAAAEEDRRIGHELHDNIQQQLTGLGLLAQSLAELMATGSSRQADMAARLAKGISEAANHVHLLSRGLVPVEVDAEGLRSALTDFAMRVREQYGIHCDFECAGAVELSDNFMATHLYRIAQEAVNNAIKHGGAKRISISLTGADESITLEVLDNGIGIGHQRPSGPGMGLRIMEYRAGLIGGTVHVAPGENGGTSVICETTKGEV